MSFELDPSYKQVPERIADFKAKHPEGSLRAADPKNPYRIETTIGGQTFIVYTAEAWRSPDDPAPGVGVAWEPVPGKTPYTRDSELQNAETSAWGRAIVAALASESKSIASAEDVRNRQAADAHEAVEQAQKDAAAQQFGWESAAQRNARWNTLTEQSKKLGEDEQALIRSNIKKAGFAVANCTPANLDWWAEQIALATPASGPGTEEEVGKDDDKVEPSESEVRA